MYMTIPSVKWRAGFVLSNSLSHGSIVLHVTTTRSAGEVGTVGTVSTVSPLFH
jgi:hypothetical protein